MQRLHNTHLSIFYRLPSSSTSTTVWCCWQPIALCPCPQPLTRPGKTPIGHDRPFLPSWLIRALGMYVCVGGGGADGRGRWWRCSPALGTDASSQRQAVSQTDSQPARQTDIVRRMLTRAADALQTRQSEELSSLCVTPLLLTDCLSSIVSGQQTGYWHRVSPCIDSSGASVVGQALSRTHLTESLVRVRVCPGRWRRWWAVGGGTGAAVVRPSESRAGNCRRWSEMTRAAYGRVDGRRSPSGSHRRRAAADNTAASGYKRNPNLDPHLSPLVVSHEDKEWHAKHYVHHHLISSCITQVNNNFVVCVF